MPQGRFRIKIAPKLIGVNVLLVLAVTIAMTFVSTGELQSSLEENFKSKGQAIALALASAAKRRGDEITAVQGSIDANKEIQGVAYIYKVEDGEVEIHTFSPNFPPDLRDANPLQMNADLSAQGGVQVANVTYQTPEGTQRAIDVAAPIAAGALGYVHVGMDRRLIENRVESLRDNVLGVGLLVALIGTLLGFAVTLVWVVRPIRELTSVTAEIVRKGDLTQRIRIRSRDEIGQLASTFQMMVERLRAIPVSLEESTQTLGASVNRLRAANREQNETVTRQASALQQAQTTVQEIKQTSLTASQRAEAVLEVAARADEVSKSGEEAIEESLTALTDIRSQVDEIAQRINDLTERTRQIGLITETVKDLADQSNMLALNAAIEAVRSGEHGKGFAVVAREIRTLADQSIQATNRVREILDDISGAIRDAVSITEKGTQRMEGGLGQVRVTGEKLRELSGIVRDNSSAARQIAAAVNQQTAGISQISTAVSDLNEMMDDTMKRLESTNDAVDGLREVSERVTDVVKSFRV
jgi:methyl-accepting chemotaxis protein